MYDSCMTRGTKKKEGKTPKRYEGDGEKRHLFACASVCEVTPVARVTPAASTGILSPHPYDNVDRLWMENSGYSGIVYDSGCWS